jgi:formate dehydrogenase subunit delta
VTAVDATGKLVMMANQIARAFEVEGRDRAVPKIAAHVEAFWDPRMKAAIAAHVAAGGEGMHPLAVAALTPSSAGAA